MGIKETKFKIKVSGRDKATLFACTEVVCHLHDFMTSRLCGFVFQLDLGVGSPPDLLFPAKPSGALQDGRGVRRNLIGSERHRGGVSVSRLCVLSTK